MSARDRTLKSLHDLLVAGLASADAVDRLAAVADRYAVAVTPAMISLIDPVDPADPIARQFVPDMRELTTHPAEIADPIGDDAKSPLPGLVHRYPDRVLLKIVGVCPVYCRFCFRREMVGPSAGRSLDDAQVEAAIGYIRRHREIWEVILTGGDPLILSARRISALGRSFSDIAQVRVLRWHTRVPVVAPQMMTPETVGALRSFARTTVIGLHVNHPRELTDEARAAIARLADAGLPLLSQSVLLSGINDDADTLEALMRALVECRVVPYYLHHGDLAPGTSHFRVPIARGLAIMEELARRLSGIARPDYVLDLPGGYGKVTLTSANVRRSAAGYEITDPGGRNHTYYDAI